MTNLGMPEVEPIEGDVRPVPLPPLHWQQFAAAMAAEEAYEDLIPQFHVPPLWQQFAVPSAAEEVGERIEEVEEQIEEVQEEFEEIQQLQREERERAEEEYELLLNEFRRASAEEFWARAVAALEQGQRLEGRAEAPAASEEIEIVQPVQGPEEATRPTGASRRSLLCGRFTTIGPPRNEEQ